MKLLRENKLLWTYDFVFIKEDGTTETQRGRYEDNDKAMRSATLQLNWRTDAIECHVYSIVRRSKMLIGMLEPMDYSFEEFFDEPVEVWKPVTQVKLKDWTIKWDEGSYEAFVNDYSFVLLDEEKDAIIYISFERDAFIIKVLQRYGISTRVDPLNTTITIIEEKEEEDDEN